MALSALPIRPARTTGTPTGTTPARRHARHLAVLALIASIHPATRAQAVQTVEVSGRPAAASGSISGWDTPLARTPLQADYFSASKLAEAGISELSGLTLLDASLSDSYNAVGYWTYFTVRGFVINNRSNFRRDGLPINAETALPLADKSGVEVLKGLSGAQAGTSAPGGLVNLVVKRPDADLRTASLWTAQGGTTGAALDLSQRFGADRAFGLRVNASVEQLRPQEHDADGHRHLLALAADWRLDADHLLEVEVEHSLQAQPSVPGFSLLGDRVPSPHEIDPRTNLNNQSWAQPVVLQGNTASVRWTQRLDRQWRLTVHAGTQHLVSNDRIAFPYGVFDPVTYDCNPCDRYSADGHVSIWDFRSDNERRRTDALNVALDGELDLGGRHHSLTLGALQSQYLGRFGAQAYNLVGLASIDGSTVLPADPSLTGPNTDRSERNTELVLRDRVALDAAWSAWLGVRHTRLHRQSSQTLGDSQTTDYRQGFTTPWLSLSNQLNAQDMVYVSWGEGVETDVTPNRATYAHPGQVLPASLSRQWEAGWKHADARAGQRWGVAAFDIRQPQSSDVAGNDGLLTRVADGRQHATGIEADAQVEHGAWTLGGSALWERMRREGAADPAIDGQRPTNVPARMLKASLGWRAAALPGLALQAHLVHEGDREVLPDNSVSIPAWTRLDLAARYTHALGGSTLTWRLGVDNAANRRAWREAPYQYDHAYLFPLETRTWKISVDASL